ncbi:uncharacterized protein LOC132333466 [Haemorhous mexicanus]|uniref:uncharacterized protein LOC132333466 n=1 Tax=Haemorhous mexicanus TaxID=30427 RepID=UPI0028BE19B1|nr:uncharacterized protein LOC132333466 [Haemorhous mexicanus]
MFKNLALIFFENGEGLLSLKNGAHGVTWSIPIGTQQRPWRCSMVQKGMNHHKTVIGKCGDQALREVADAAGSLALGCGSALGDGTSTRGQRWGLFLSWLLLVRALSCTKNQGNTSAPPGICTSLHLKHSMKFHPLLLQQVLVTQFLLTAEEEAQVSSENERLEGWAHKLDLEEETSMQRCDCSVNTVPGSRGNDLKDPGRWHTQKNPSDQCMLGNNFKVH